MDLNQLVSYCLPGGDSVFHNITGDQTDNTDWLCSQQLWRKEKDENIELKKKYSIFRLKYYRTVPSRIKCIHTKIPVLLYGSINSQL